MRNYISRYSYTTFDLLKIKPVFVPQKSAYIVQRFGKFNRQLNPGLNFIVPLIDQISYRHNLKQQSIDITHQTAITKDNVTLQIDGTLFIKIWDPIEASYKVQNPKQSIRLLALTVMRSQIGKLKFDQLLQQRDKINKQIHDAVNKSAKIWGVQCLRYQILDIQPPDTIRKSMEYQVQAQRMRRSQVLISQAKQIGTIKQQQGKKLSAIYVAEGKAQAVKIVAAVEKQVNQLLNSSLTNKIITQYVLLNTYLDNYKQLLQKSNVIVSPSTTEKGGSTNLMGLAMMISNLRGNNSNFGYKSPNNQQALYNKKQSNFDDKKKRTSKKYEDQILNSTEQQQLTYK